MMYQDDDFMNMVEELKHADKLQWLNISKMLSEKRQDMI